jgi:hypothetical protein
LIDAKQIPRNPHLRKLLGAQHQQRPILGVDHHQPLALNPLTLGGLDDLIPQRRPQRKKQQRVNNPTFALSHEY